MFLFRGNIFTEPQLFLGCIDPQHLYRLSGHGHLKHNFIAVSLGNALKVSLVLFFTGGSPAALFKVVGKNLWMESKPACKVREGKGRSSALSQI